MRAFVLQAITMKPFHETYWEYQNNFSVIFRVIECSTINHRCVQVSIGANVFKPGKHDGGLESPVVFCYVTTCLKISDQFGKNAWW